MTDKQRVLRKSAAAALDDTMKILNAFSAPGERDEFDRAWKVGVFQQLSNIAHELEMLNQHPSTTSNE